MSVVRVVIFSLEAIELLSIPLSRVDRGIEPPPLGKVKEGRSEWAVKVFPRETEGGGDRSVRNGRRPIPQRM